MRRAMGTLAGISWKRLEKEHSVTYPCKAEDLPGESVLFTETFPTQSGKARLTPAPFTNADELPDDQYPWILITGRQLEHWHTGSMTRRSTVLGTIEPDPVVTVHPDDLARLGVQPGDPIEVRSRRGTVTAYARSDAGLQTGQVFMPFCYKEAAANLLTNEALDPFGKIPEFKFCAVQVAPVRQ
jgi:formate dehydrogenase major subunit